MRKPASTITTMQAAVCQILGLFHHDEHDQERVCAAMSQFILRHIRKCGETSATRIPNGFKHRCYAATAARQQPRSPIKALKWRCAHGTIVLKPSQRPSRPNVSCPDGGVTTAFFQLAEHACDPCRGTLKDIYSSMDKASCVTIAVHDHDAARLVFMMFG